MLKSIFNRKNNSQIPHDLYGAVVAQARLPVFFAELGFPDTVMGRFDVLTLHTFLLCRRLGFEEQTKATRLSQEVFDCFINNLDVALRELGIGDSSVPKKKKKLVRSFYGQVEDFDQPIKSGDLALLSGAVNKRFFDDKNSPMAQKLAEYCLAVSDRLSETTIETFYDGKLPWLVISGSDS